MKNGRVRPKIGNILFNILSIVTLIAVAFVLFNIVSGAKGYAVTSESMEKTLSRGDIVFSKKIKRKIDFQPLYSLMPCNCNLFYDNFSRFYFKNVR